MDDEYELRVPPGHHHSPIPSAVDVDRALAVAAAAGPSLPGIALRGAEQMAMLQRWQVHYDDLHLAREPGPDRFYLDNEWFTCADAVGYALMLRALRPERVVEVGSGFSSALALDVAERHLDRAPEFRFIDPDPRRLQQLARPGDLAGRLLIQPVQQVPVAVFEALRSGDILFIDSSHVMKAGSDVQYLFAEVLPRLPAGVFVHIHDVFYPFEYPESWLRRGTFLNEAYVLRTLLEGGSRFRIELFNDYLVRFHRPWFAAHMPLFLEAPFPTGGIWLQTRRQRDLFRRRNDPPAWSRPL